MGEDAREKRKSKKAPPLHASAADDPVARRRAAVQDYGEWLQKYQWHHFVTLTFKFPMTAKEALQKFNRWRRWIERSAQRAVLYFAGVELGAQGEGVHVHALVYGTLGLPVDVLAAAWKEGYSRVRIYDPTDRAAFYVAKCVHDTFDHYDLSPKLQPIVPTVRVAGSAAGDRGG